MLSYLGGMSQTLASVSVMHMLMFLFAVFHERGCVQQCFGNQRSPVAPRGIVFCLNLDDKVPVSRQLQWHRGKKSELFYIFVSCRRKGCNN